ncbi:MAG: sulfatase [Solirubrobacterales bacterium]|nr:sulfatase [Solirubrobacterales bacterium]OJU95341.1 MAG: sulfatase [Solirubrobacterales bacterium 67-14]
MNDRPNIVYVHSHDTGRQVQPYGHQVLTPNIQLLADQGITFRRAFCAAPTCSGSRAALLTGQHCHNNGMTGLAHRGWKLNDYSQHLVHPLKAAGYNTILVGEQHISRDPHVIGYDEVIELSDNYAKRVAPSALEALRRTSEPFFMSVGFFETHRDFAAPTSVRDSLYSLPPSNLPDTAETRSDMAAFKESVRSLDQGIGALLNGLHASGVADRTLVICTTDHGLAFPKAKATLYDEGIGVMLLMRGPDGFSGGKVIDSMVSHLDLYPTICDLAGVPHPGFLQGRSLMPLVRGEMAELHDELFSEVTYHAAYEPQRAVRTNRWKYIRRFGSRKKPVLANCDDSATKELLISMGWGEREVAREQLFDLYLDPEEENNLAGDPSSADVLVDMRRRLDRWMEETDDPIRLGPIPPPPGAEVNDPDQISPDEPLTVIPG